MAVVRVHLVLVQNLSQFSCSMPHFVTEEMHDIFKNVWPIVLGFVLPHCFLCTSSDIRGLTRFFVVENISKYHHWYCLLT